MGLLDLYSDPDQFEASGGLIGRLMSLQGGGEAAASARRPSEASQYLSAAFQNCANAHRLCILSGRPEKDCLRALYRCSRSGNGLPTIFAPGVVGTPD